jgi:trehalose 6-phosphate phosphatase
VYESEFDRDKLVDRIVRLLDGPNAGLITDVDGTISPIEALPEQARVLQTALDALADLRHKVAVLAVVSGRSALDAQRMVDLDRVTYIGNHGLEILTADGPEIVPEAQPWVPRVATALACVAATTLPTGVVVENKGASGSIHYRLTSDPDTARTQLLLALDTCAVPAGLRIEEGRMVVNLLPPLTVSKGSAVSRLARERGLRRLVYFGDDVTDAHAFRALAQLHDEEGLETLSVGVVGAETPAIVHDLADTTVPHVQAVAEVLHAVSGTLRSSARMDAGVPFVHGHT